MGRLRRALGVLRHVLRRGYWLGRCPVCERRTIFYLKGTWIRAHLRCARCDSRPRQRALVEVLRREFPDWRRWRIHESSPGGPIDGWFRRECPQYTPSFAFPDVPRGGMQDGYRSETLEAQTFEDAAFDLVITQDVFEHVLEPARAFAEIARTLRPGGAHVFTVPWFYWQPTQVRSQLQPDGTVDHLLPPEYHGNPLGGGSLVVTDWGRDFLQFVDGCAATTTEVFRLDDAELGITGAYLDVFVSRKHDPARVRDADRPDIVVILADDLGYADVGFNGSREIKTPNLDALASAGVVLEQLHVQPACTPTRAALMTGRYPMRYGLQVAVIRPTSRYGLPLDERTLPQALRDAGYTTVAVGKWHLGSFDKAYWPTARGFDHHYGHLFGTIDYFTHRRDDVDDWYRDGEPLREAGYSTHLLAREAERVITAQPRDTPLFLYLAFNAVHTPHQVPEPYKKPYAALPEPRRTYAGMVAALDEAVGRVLGAIKATRRGKQTLVIFSGDNGGPDPGLVTDNGRLRSGKGAMYEGGVRTPAVVAWEGRIKPGRRVADPLHVVDWYPTLLNLIGKAVDASVLDGRDIWPTIAEGRPLPDREVLLNAAPSGGAIRVGDWKLVVEGDGEELFNLREDPSENTNLADGCAEKVRELRERYDRLAQQAAVPMSTETITRGPADGRL